MVYPLRTTDILLHIYKNPEDMAEQTAEVLLEHCERAIKERGTCSLAISGGKTPLPLFMLLGSKEWCNKFPWEKISIYWVDEHCVPIDSEYNNYTIAKKLFLTNVSSTRFYRIRGELPPQEAMTLYTELLKNHFSLQEGELPRFDVILLGVGITGYVASIYPDSPALVEEDALLSEVYVEEEEHARITMTMPVINAARCVIFMVSGKQKAPVLAKALNILAPPTIPPQFVRPTAGKVIWNVDEEATLYSKE